MITAKIGMLETGEPFILDFSMAAHSAIQGSTRSGKSVLCHSILAWLSRYENVRIAGIDPSGILLAPWADDTDWIALGTGDVNAYVTVLDNLVQEMDRRIAEDLREKGLDKLEDFTPELPLIVLVLEEAPGIFDAVESADAAEGLKPAERRLPKIRRSLSRLVSESAKIGTRVLILSQRFDADVIGGRQRSQFATAITMRVPDMTAVRMLHTDCPDDIAALVPHFPPGVGIVERPGAPLQRFKAAYLDYQNFMLLTRRKENV